MRIHHLNCGSLHPVGQRLLRDPAAPVGSPTMVCHCLLIEAGDDLVLVDTGLGLADIARASTRLSRAFLKASRPGLVVAETAARQVEALGFRREDVRHIVLTHLDPDHAGGLTDFPHAKVHVLATEHVGGTARPRALERTRYRPTQWAHGPRWELYAPAGEPWFGFEAVRDLRGLPPELLMVPLSGHSRGHAGVAVNTEQGWLLHCGDAYFHRGDVHDGATCPAALTLFQRLGALNNGQVRANQARLRSLARERRDEVRLFCSHDPVELAALRDAATT